MAPITEPRLRSMAARVKTTGERAGRQDFTGSNNQAVFTHITNTVEVTAVDRQQQISDATDGAGIIKESLNGSAFNEP